MSKHPIISFFEWWNVAMRDVDQLTPHAFARHFTSDGRLVVNGAVRAEGPDALSAHYRAIAARLEELEMVLPVKEGFATPDRAFVHCYTRAVDKGQPLLEEAMAYANVCDGRMSLLQVFSRPN